MRVPLSDPPSSANGYKLSPDYWLDYLAYAVLRLPKANRANAVAAMSGRPGFPSQEDLMQRVKDVHVYERQRRTAGGQ